MRREPFRNSTHGNLPSRSNLQTVVRLKFNARAACAIDSNRRSVGPAGASDEKTAATRLSSAGVATSNFPISASLFIVRTLSLSPCPMRGYGLLFDTKPIQSKL
jgi:hypothetical protein